MLRNRELVGHAVGGAAIGLAVGMAIQKILSPRVLQHSPIIAETEISCKSMKKRSRSKNLKIPSHHHKNHHNRHSRSKSACEGPKAFNDESHSAIWTSSSAKSELSSPEQHLRSRSENSRNLSKIDKKYKIIDKSELGSSKTDLRLKSQNYRNITKKFSDSLEFILDSTEYLPIKWNNPKKTPVSLLFDINNRKSHVNFSFDASSQRGLDDFESFKATCDSVEKDAEFSSYRESIVTMSTEYLPVSKRIIKNSQPTIPIFDENNYNFISIDNLKNGDKTIDGIIATRVTRAEEYLPISSTKIINSGPTISIFDEKNRNFTSIDSLVDEDKTIYGVISTCAKMTKEFDLRGKMKKSDEQKFVTLPTFYDTTLESIEDGEK